MSFVGLLAYSGVTIRVYFIARLMRVIWKPGANQPSSDHGGGSGEKMDISVFLPPLSANNSIPKRTKYGSLLSYRRLDTLNRPPVK